VLRTYYGEFPGHQLGYCVGGGGDVNHDGFADLLLGSLVLSGSQAARRSQARMGRSRSASSPEERRC